MRGNAAAQRSAFPAQRISRAAQRSAAQRSVAQCEGSRLRRHSASEREGVARSRLPWTYSASRSETSTLSSASPLFAELREREQTFATVKGSGQHHQRLRASGHAMHKRLPLRLCERGLFVSVLVLLWVATPPARRAGGVATRRRTGVLTQKRRLRAICRRG